MAQDSDVSVKDLDCGSVRDIPSMRSGTERPELMTFRQLITDDDRVY